MTVLENREDNPSDAATNFGSIRQLGYLVENIESAVELWMDTQFIGPWTIIKNVPLNCVYHGEPSQPIIHIALAYRGDVQIELIQQLDREPSPYLRYIERKQFCLHHTAYLCDDINAAVAKAESAGHNVVCDINMPDGGRYVYTQVDGLGEDVFIEFLEATDRMKHMFTAGIVAAENWTGDKQVAVFDFSTKR